MDVSHYSQPEDSADSDFSTSVHLQSPDYPHGEEDDYDVHDHVHNRCQGRADILWKTGSAERFVPIVSERAALRKNADDESNAKDALDNHDSVTDAAETNGGEDGNIQARDRDLDQSDDYTP